MTRLLDSTELDALPPVTRLAATRPDGYDHHGIYLGDGQVFELMKDDGRARMQVVPIASFAKGNPVSIVEHEGREHSPFRHFDADPPTIVLDRIRRLLALGDVGRYNLWGLNCEHVTAWCMTGVADSIQVRRRWFAPNLVIGGIVALGVSLAIRSRKTIPLPWLFALASFYVLRMIPVVQSRLGAWRFTALVAREQPPPAWYWTTGAASS